MKKYTAHEPEDIARKLFGLPYASLDERAQKVARHVATRKHIARNLAQPTDAPSNTGERAADAVARFGGSWVFVAIFITAMVIWIGVNGVLLWQRGSTFDPYPFILLNLFLSMLAAIQAPVILMAQNRKGDRDRASAEHDYEVNLKAELEIMLLHEKIDALREIQWEELLALQREQLRLLQGHAATPAPLA